MHAIAAPSTLAHVAERHRRAGWGGSVAACPSSILFVLDVSADDLGHVGVLLFYFFDQRVLGIVLGGLIRFIRLDVLGLEGATSVGDIVPGLDRSRANVPIGRLRATNPSRGNQGSELSPDAILGARRRPTRGQSRPSAARRRTEAGQADAANAGPRKYVQQPSTRNHS
jgi:hypothetical protein